MKYAILAGHGGVAWDQYLTAGKRSPRVGPGIGVYEGWSNRYIAFDLTRRLRMENIDAEFLNPGPLPVTLLTKIKSINRIARNVPDICVIEIHSNAAGNGKTWHTARGTRIFAQTVHGGKKRRQWAETSYGMAERVDLVFKSNSDLPWREYNRPIARRTPFKLFNVRCPAILIECFFHTHLKDAAWASDISNLQKISKAIAEGVHMFERGHRYLRI
jgi:N-acetylmuramoyl-L-alanine amidase